MLVLYSLHDIYFRLSTITEITLQLFSVNPYLTSRINQYSIFWFALQQRNRHTTKAISHRLVYEVSRSQLPILTCHDRTFFVGIRVSSGRERTTHSIIH